jgi:diadenosine tetraphosphate (Ap4A) HIT family hydrolase
VYNAFKPDKLNYELLGQGELRHMHWHLFPRYKGDTPEAGPVWKLSKEEMYSEKYIPSDEELEEMKERLRTELEKLI